MTPQELTALHSKVQEISRLDRMMECLARNPEDKLEELGKKVLGVLGRNVIDKRKDWVGEVVFVAVFNALRENRERLCDEIKDRVDVSPCIHKVQEVQDND